MIGEIALAVFIDVGHWLMTVSLSLQPETSIAMTLSMDRAGAARLFFVSLTQNSPCLNELEK
jgi:hypothetical protein